MSQIANMPSPRPARTTVALWIGVLLVLAIAIVGWMTLPVNEWVHSFTSWARRFGLLGAIVFGLGYVVAVVLLVPVWPLSIAAGLAFGMMGVPLVVASATVGAALAFLVARYLMRDRVRKFASSRPVLEALDQAATEEGWKVVGLLRLSPLVPFNLQNYFLGATDISFRIYLVATFFGIMPGAAAYVYLGTLGQLATSPSGPSGVKTTLLVVGFAATAVLVFIVGRKAKMRLESLGVTKDRV